MRNNRAHEPNTARAILHYLQEHPDAKDTLDGIAQWWLVRESTDRKFAEVQRAITLLLEEDFIVETRRTGSPPYYRLNQDKKKEIAKLLETELSS